MEPTTPITADELLVQSGWMHALAVRLVQNAAAADDVVQEAFLAAVRRARGGEPTPRGWFARVVYNQAALQARGERHRRAREERSAQLEALPSSAELAARAELQKHVIEALIALHDPYRTVLLLHYYEDLSPKEIAQRQRVPGSTVRNQLARGHELLRDRLDAVFGDDRRSWVLVLVPMAVARDGLAPGARVSTTPIKGLPVRPFVSVIGTCALVASLAWLALEFTGVRVGDAAPSADARPTIVAQESADDAGAAASDYRVGETIEQTAVSAAAPADVAADLVTRTSDAFQWITFKVENARGMPVPGAEVVIKTLYQDGGFMMMKADEDLGRGKTETDGTLKLQNPRWPDNANGSEGMKFTVAHADYMTAVSSTDVVPEIRTVLQVGATLQIQAWTGERSNVVSKWRARFSADVNVAPDEWLPHRDGSLSTIRVPPGRHLVLLEAETESRSGLFSDVIEFAIEAGENKRLSLELKAGARLVAELDPEVPRPVRGGHAELRVYPDTGDPESYLWMEYQAEVAPNGTFTIDSLPKFDAEIAVLCHGWSSKRRLFASTVDGVSDSGETADGAQLAQPIDLRSDTSRVVIEMEPTATLVVRLRQLDETPVPGAQLRILREVAWRNHLSQVWPGSHAHIAETNSEGEARLEDVPAGDQEFDIVHAEFDLPFEAGKLGRWRRVHLRPGESLPNQYTVVSTQGR